MAEEKIAPFKERVLDLITELVAPKDSFNSFGKYNYRSTESITQALKPMCIKFKVLPNMTEENSPDEAPNPWVRAIVTLYDVYSDEKISSSSKVFIDSSKKGMSKEQMSGAALSYARKYALGGLLLIDDTKDPDTDEYTRQNSATNAKPKSNTARQQETDAEAHTADNEPITDADVKRLEGMLAPNQLSWVLSHCGVKELSQLTKKQYTEVVNGLKRNAEAKGKA